MSQKVLGKSNISNITSLQQILKSPAIQAQLDEAKDKFKQLLIKKNKMKDSLPYEAYPGLWVGNVCFSQNEQFLKNSNVRLVISCLQAEPSNKLQGVQYFKIPVRDLAWFPIQQHFETFYNKVQKSIQVGEAVFVYCFSGISRSVTLALSFIIKKTKNTFQSAISELKQRYPLANPNSGFIQKLKIYQKQVFQINKFDQGNQAEKINQQTSKQQANQQNQNQDHQPQQDIIVQKITNNENMVYEQDERISQYRQPIQPQQKHDLINSTSQNAQKQQYNQVKVQAQNEQQIQYMIMTDESKDVQIKEIQEQDQVSTEKKNNQEQVYAEKIEENTQNQKQKSENPIEISQNQKNIASQQNKDLQIKAIDQNEASKKEQANVADQQSQLLQQKQQTKVIQDQKDEIDEIDEKQEKKEQQQQNMNQKQNSDSSKKGQNSNQGKNKKKKNKKKRR